VTVAELFTETPAEGGVQHDRQTPGGSPKSEPAEVSELREQFEALIAGSPEAVTALKPILSYLAEGRKARKKGPSPK